MAELTHLQYDALERAIANGTRIVVYRRGTEYIVVPTRLVLTGGRHPRVRSVMARMGPVAVHVLLCCIGVLVMVQAGTFSLL